MKSRRARNLFPEPAFQLRFVRFLFLGSLAQIALLFGVLFCFVGESHRVLQVYGGVDPRVWPELMVQLRTFIGLLAVVFFAYMAVVTLIAIFYSQRIGGVIFAIKRNLNATNAGNFQELRLRKGDEFQDVTDAVNRVIRKLRELEEVNKKVGS